MASLTFHGGVDEIGGNKILVEDRGTRVFLDFGMQMGRLNEYYSEFLSPRKLSGMGDLFEFGLLPRVGGIYRRDYARHMGSDPVLYGGGGERYRGGEDSRAETSVHGVVLSHAHVDHCAYIGYLRPEIPVYCTEESRMIMEAFDARGRGDQYIRQWEAFAVNAKGGRASRASLEPEERDIRPMAGGRKFRIDSMEFEPVAIDHSLPGVCGLIVHTSEGTIGYTADIRFHGRRGGDSQRFVDRCAGEGVGTLLCEGTRVGGAGRGAARTEEDIEGSVSATCAAARRLVVCTYPVRDLDRMLSFYNAARAAGRDLVVDTQQAYLLRLFSESESCRGRYPGPDDPHIKVFMSRKSWGLVGRDGWPGEAAERDYDGWERGFLGADNMVDHAHVAANQKDLVFFCSDFRLTDLIDVRPAEGSAYVRSSTEPFNEEMGLDHERVRRWLRHFGLLTSDEGWRAEHVSGHGDEGQIRRVVEGASPGSVIPIHTENARAFEGMHGAVRTVSPGERVAV